MICSAKMSSRPKNEKYDNITKTIYNIYIANFIQFDKYNYILTPYPFLYKTYNSIYETEV